MDVVNGERRYNVWAGRPKGTAEDPTSCIEEIYPNERGGYAQRYQCLRKRGKGPEGLYCAQHDPSAKESREKARQARWDQAAATLQFEHDIATVGKFLANKYPEAYHKLLARARGK